MNILFKIAYYLLHMNVHFTNVYSYNLVVVVIAKTSGAMISFDATVAVAINETQYQIPNNYYFVIINTTKNTQKFTN